MNILLTFELTDDMFYRKGKEYQDLSDHWLRQ